MGSTSYANKGCKAGSGKTLTIDLEALLSELQQDPTDESGAMTTNEIMEATGRSRHSISALLRKAKAAGRLKAVKVPREAVDGAVRNCPAYIFE